MIEEKKQHAFICSRGTLDGAYPALVLALNAVRLGDDATVFFTFMGLDVIRKNKAKSLKFFPPGFMGAIPGMSWMATFMMKRMIHKANIPEVQDMLEMCQLEGVKFVACHMTMDMMSLTTDDLLEDVTVMTASEFLAIAKECQLHLFT